VGLGTVHGLGAHGLGFLVCRLLCPAKQQKTAGVAGGFWGAVRRFDQLRVCLSSRQAVREPKVRKV